MLCFPTLGGANNIYSRLAMVAFRQVLVQRQTGYREVVAWLERETRAVTVGGKGVDVEMLVRVVRGAGARQWRKAKG